MGVNAALWKEEQSAEIIHQLATLLHAGLTLSEGLELLAKQHPHRQWQALLRTLAHELEQGVPFSSALVSWAAGISAALPDDDPHRRTGPANWPNAALNWPVSKKRNGRLRLA
ncbi:type IV pilin biogenesis protein [Salmonella enterica subsp. indica]|uniref:Type IV pilin biogenesis protein n=1 Tax=Salmonella enterica subsp. indica TaxID=59207 RepID=A0A379XUF0_SALER|nr:type IV pilin biogenesis protein [Salmonella enterica subsp. indica]